MHERHEFTIWKVERWSKQHSLPLRVKIHLKGKMFGSTSGPTLVDVLNRQTLKPKSPVMHGEILRTLDLEHMFQLDQEGAYCRDGYLYEGNIFQCCPEFKCLLRGTSAHRICHFPRICGSKVRTDVPRYKHACDCAEDEVPDLLVDVVSPQAMLPVLVVLGR